MDKFIKVQGYVENSETMASHEVSDMIMNLVDQFRELGFSDDDIKEGIELVLDEEL